MNFFFNNILPLLRLSFSLFKNWYIVTILPYQDLEMNFLFADIISTTYIMPQVVEVTAEELAKNPSITTYSIDPMKHDSNLIYLTDDFALTKHTIDGIF